MTDAQQTARQIRTLLEENRLLRIRERKLEKALRVAVGYALDPDVDGVALDRDLARWRKVLNS